ncbi:MAG TPA: glycoside hydrolase family 15 protein [Steroidobacteraceae bacterium]|jgi:GH15 family glucan-1,4-alpha-glucosidase
MSKPLEDYGLIGDGHTAALVSRDGSIDWLCWPRFDSPACLAALLGDDRNGCWRISPTTALSRQSRRYRPSTLILEQDLETDGGAIQLVDFMPMDSHTIVRTVRGVRGCVPMHMILTIRFEYGVVPGWTDCGHEGATIELGSHRLTLNTCVPLSADAGTIGADFDVRAGDQIDFVLRFGTTGGSAQPQANAAAAFRATEDYWRDWLGRFTKDTFWPEAVRRSLLTLGALVYQPSGGIVAAPTTSLPEQPGGELNWDYRYCWVRDATFTLCALLNSGLRKEAEAWLAWLVRAVGSDPAELRIMYRLDGGRRINEYQLDRLPGYRHARPVRIGNAASTQRQLDVFGELLDAFNIAKRAGIPRSSRLCEVEHAIANHLAEIWQLPGQGMWESRGEPRHYVYSKVMCWVGIDRYIRNVGAELDKKSRTRFETLRDIIHQDICAEGYHSGLKTFVHFYGGQTVDASLLMLPLVGFLPIEDPRIVSTITCIERELMRGGLVYRHQLRRDPEEGAFIACSFWLVDCWRMQGRQEEARTLFERILALANDLGLLSEEYNVEGRRLAGNFPQALSHLSLINSAVGFSGPVLQRAGG